MSISDRQKLSRHILEFYCFFKTCCDQGYYLTSHDTPFSAMVLQPAPDTGFFDAESIYKKVDFQPVKIQRDKIKRVTDSGYDSMNISVNLIEPFISFVKQEALIGLQMIVGQIYTEDLKNIYAVEDYSIAFYGRCATVNRTDNTLDLEFTGWNKELESSVPTYFFMRSCNHLLYEFRTCGLNRALFTFPATITAIDSSRKLLTVTLANAKPSGVFIGGEISFGTGDCGRFLPINNDTNIGVNFFVRNLRLLGYIPDFVSVGDVVNLSYGCDRKWSTCQAKFHNQPAFGGFPFISTRNPATDRMDGV